MTGPRIKRDELNATDRIGFGGLKGRHWLSDPSNAIQPHIPRMEALMSIRIALALLPLLLVPRTPWPLRRRRSTTGVAGRFAGSLMASRPAPASSGPPGWKHPVGQQPQPA